MENHLSGTRRQILAVLLISTLVGVLCAAVNLGVLPDRGGPSAMLIGAASTHVLVDSPERSIVLRRPLPQDQNTLVGRGEIMGRLIVSPLVLDRVAASVGVPSDQVSGLARTTASAPLAFTEPGGERRASEIYRSTRPYRLEVQVRQWTPIIDIYAQAPSADAAEKVADAAVKGAQAELAATAVANHVPPSKLVVLRQLGPSHGGLVNKRTPMIIAALTFIVAFALSLAGLLACLAIRRRAHGTPVAAKPDPEPDRSDSWPHTTRVLPWMFAGFLVILWLLPFNVITLNASLPVDLNLDRLVLPFILAVWVLAVAAGGRAAPRLRLTWIHVAFGAFTAIAFLSVVLDARYLNQALEFDLSLKKLPLLVTYGAFFLVAASAIRRTEVKPFMTYSLILGVLCALGMLWEYRFKQNLFYEWSHKLLPAGLFTVGQDRATALDHLGRRLVSGPAEEPLEAVTMLCMALPIGLVGFIQARNSRGRLLYGIATACLLAATFATYRKSAMIAPVVIGLTVAYFRRRDLLKLAPLTLVAVIAVSVLSPGAIGSTVSQFTRSDRMTVPTVSDRTSDYDAVRPDVWTHIAFGRGWGSYNHETYRILDSDILQRIIETGALGLVFFVLMCLSVVLSARGTIALRDREAAPIALIGAAAAMGYLVSATLYDLMSFPHGTYIFLYLAGLTAVVVNPRKRRTLVPAAASPPPHALRRHRPPRLPSPGRSLEHAGRAHAD